MFEQIKHRSKYKSKTHVVILVLRIKLQCYEKEMLFYKNEVIMLLKML